MFYKATVQSVFLFRSKTWVLAPVTLKHLEGFHVKAARRMTGLLPKMTGGTWNYPKTKTVLAAAGLHTIKHYMKVRRASIMRWVIDRSILKLCSSAERRRGTTPRLYWWEQPMDLDKARAGRPPMQPLKKKEGMGDTPPSHWKERNTMHARHSTAPR